VLVLALTASFPTTEAVVFRVVSVATPIDFAAIREAVETIDAVEDAFCVCVEAQEEVEASVAVAAEFIIR
jgi:hypothetical protein